MGVLASGVGGVANRERDLGAKQVGNETSMPTSQAQEFGAPSRGQTSKTKAISKPTSANAKPGAAAARAAPTSPAASTKGAAENALKQPDAPPAPPRPGAGGGGNAPGRNTKYARAATSRGYGKRRSKRARA